MMHEIDIVYASTRAHAYRTYLIPLETIKRDLINSKSLEELVGFLQLTRYRDYMVQLAEVTLESLVNGFKSYFSDIAERFIKVLPGNARDLMETHLFRFDIDGVLEVISEKMAGIEHKSRDYYVLPFTKVDIGRFLKAETVDACVDQLAYPPFNIDKAYIDLWKKYRTIYIIEMALRRQYYIKYIRALEHLEEEDRDSLGEIIGTEIDITNIAIAIGPLLYGYSPSIAWDMLIPYEYKVSLESLKKAYGLETEVIMKMVPEPYKDVAEYYLVGSDIKAKSLGGRIIMRKILAMLHKFPIHFTYVYGIIRLFEFEYRNLKAIAESIYYGLAPTEIKELLILDESL